MGPLGQLFKIGKRAYRGIAKEYGSEETRQKIAEQERREAQWPIAGCLVPIILIGLIVAFIWYVASTTE